MNLSYTKEYYPNLDELTPTQLEDAREFVIQKLREKFSEVDLSPGTVMGDQVVAPLSDFIAAADLAFSRFMSDLDLGNVAENVIYSCPFVTGYLGNFAVYDDSNLLSLGVVRLTFVTNVGYSFPRNTAFKFGSVDEYRIRFSNAASETFQILPAGTLDELADDTLVMSQTSETTWAVDLPVEGVMTAPVLQASAGTINILPSNLSAITAIENFISGSTSTSLATLAKDARNIHHSMSASSREGIRSTVFHHWPDTKMVSPVIPGDPEMTRGTPSGLALPQPSVDVFYRSSLDQRVETQLIKLQYVDDVVVFGGPVEKRFRGKLTLLHSPSKIISIEAVYTADGLSGITSYDVFTRPTRTDLTPGLQFGSRYEDFYIDVTPSMNGLEPMPSLQYETIDDVLTPYATFRVVYECDPLLRSVAAHLESTDQAAAGVSTIVKAGPLVDLDTMTIRYHRRQGVRMVLTPAANRIADYARTAGYPEVFSQARVHDIMKLAGASLVASITVSGVIRLSAADYCFVESFDPVADLSSNWMVYAAAIPQPAVSSVSDIVPNNVGLDLVDYNETLDTMSISNITTRRTSRYRIERDGITFLEQ